MTTTNIISTPEITGNIGSCKAENNTYSVSSFYTRSTTVNSCSGQIINDTTYYDWSYIYFPSTFIIVVLFFALAIKMAND